MTRIADLMATIDALKSHAFHCPICVKEVNADEVKLIVVAAQENMVRNIAVVRQIADVTVQDLDNFWGVVKLLEFSDPVFGDVLMGLASMDGSRVYISRKLITRSDQLACQQALEFEYANALSRWGNPNPYLVSSCTIAICGLPIAQLLWWGLATSTKNAFTKRERPFQLHSISSAMLPEGSENLVLR